MIMIKKYWWVIALGIMLLLVLFWPKSKKNEEKITPTPVVSYREDGYLPIELPKIQSVTWLIPKNIELPEINRIKIRKQTIDTAREIKIKEMLGIKDGNGYIDKTNNIVGYNEEIKSIKQLPTKGNWDIDALKSKLKNISEEINGVGNMEIIWTRVKYQEILYPRWIESTESKSQSVEIRGDYLINNIRTTTYFGESIKGTFNKDGQLLNLVVSLRPEILPGEGKEELINIDEASKSPIDMYGVADNAGIEKIGQVNITQAEIVQVYSNRMSIIKPYFWLSGNTFSENKPIKILLLLKAEK